MFVSPEWREEVGHHVEDVEGSPGEEEYQASAHLGQLENIRLAHISHMNCKIRG